MYILQTWNQLLHNTADKIMVKYLWIIFIEIEKVWLNIFDNQKNPFVLFLIHLFYLREMSIPLEKD